MLTCESCFRVLGTIEESSEIAVRGEIKLIILCQSCTKVNNIVLYEYNKKRLKQVKKE